MDIIQRARKIFQRIRNYAVYRIACTSQILLFVFLSAIAFPLDKYYGAQSCDGADDASMDDRSDDGFVRQLAHPSSFTFPVVCLAIITILNDGCIISVAYDKVSVERLPLKWDITEMVTIGLSMGIVAFGSSIGLFYALLETPYGKERWYGSLFGQEGDYVTLGELITIMFLKVALSDFMTLFAARTRGFFWERRPGYLLLGAFAAATLTSTMLSLYWENIFSGSASNGVGDTSYNMRSLDQSYAAISVWVFCILTFIAQDLFKVVMYWLLDQFRARSALTRPKSSFLGRGDGTRAAQIRR